MSKIKWDDMPNFIVWNRVKSLRRNMKLNQAQVAVGAGIAVNTLWMIEQGYDEKTTKETKKKLADFFKCDIDDIFPSKMIGNKPAAQPKEKAIAKLQFFAPKKVDE